MSEPFTFTEVQANFILDTTLGRLTRLGEDEITAELEELHATIRELELVLSDDVKLRGVIREELLEVGTRFAEGRRTRIVNDDGELSMEDLIADEEIVVSLTRAGYVKAVLASAFKAQARGGRGVSSAKLREEDLLESLVYTTSHSNLLLFSNFGRVYRLRGHEVPLKERTARGTPVVNLVPLSAGERINTMVDTRHFEADAYLFFCTRSGQVKKTLLTEYDKSRRDGFIAITLREGDELVRVMRASGGGDVVLFSRDGMTIRFPEQDVRPMGRSAAGVRGMKLRGDDLVVSCDVITEGKFVLVVTDGGFAKRTSVNHFGKQARGGVGIKAIRLNQRRGTVAAAFLASLDDEVIAVSSGGVAIRTAVRQIAAQGRDATGVRLMSLDAGQKLVAVATVSPESE
jgi:DNA gyrase subunit A